MPIRIGAQRQRSRERTSTVDNSEMQLRMDGASSSQDADATPEAGVAAPSEAVAAPPDAVAAPAEAVAAPAEAVAPPPATLTQDWATFTHPFALRGATRDQLLGELPKQRAVMQPANWKALSFLLDESGAAKLLPSDVKPYMPKVDAQAALDALIGLGERTVGQIVSLFDGPTVQAMLRLSTPEINRKVWQHVAKAAGLNAVAKDAAKAVSEAGAGSRAVDTACTIVLSGVFIPMKESKPADRSKRGGDDDFSDLDKKFGANNVGEFGSGSLKRIRDVMSALPEEHTSQNDSMKALLREKEMSRFSPFVAGGNLGGTSGWYGDSEGKKNSGVVAMSYTKAYNRQDVQNGELADDNDALKKMDNLFDATLRHEVGHAVANKMGLEDTYCALPEGGGWRKYADSQGFADDLVDHAADGSDILKAITESGMSDSQARSALKAVLASMATKRGKAGKGDLRTAFRDAFEKEGAKRKSGTATSLAAKLLDSELGKAMKQAFESPHASSSPKAINGRVFQEAYKGSELTSYDFSARAKKVSKYQFRSAGEWFAEVYSAYYEPEEDGKPKGHVLRGADPTTADFIQQHVDKKNDKQTKEGVGQKMAALKGGG